MSTTSPTLPTAGAGLIAQLKMIIAARFSSSHPRAAGRLGLLWPVSTCSICDEPYGYHFASYSGEPSFDSSCACANLGLEPRTWADVADTYVQQSPAVCQWWAFEPPTAEQLPLSLQHPAPAEPITETTKEALLLSAARVGYQAYGAHQGGLNYQGLPMPTFEQLPADIVGAWAAAALAILQLSSGRQA